MKGNVDTLTRAAHRAGTRHLVIILAFLQPSLGGRFPARRTIIKLILVVEIIILRVLFEQWVPAQWLCKVDRVIRYCLRGFRDEVEC